MEEHLRRVLVASREVEVASIVAGPPVKVALRPLRPLAAKLHRAPVVHGVSHRDDGGRVELGKLLQLRLAVRRMVDQLPEPVGVLLLEPHQVRAELNGLRGAHLRWDKGRVTRPAPPKRQIGRTWPWRSPRRRLALVEASSGRS